MSFICPSIHPSVCPSVRPSIRTSVRPSARLCIRLYVCPPVSPSVRPSVCPSVRPSVYSSVRLSVCPSIRPHICPSVCPSMRPSLRPSACLSVLSVYPSVRLSMSVCPSVYPYICPSVCPSMHPSLRPSACLSVRPSIRPSVRLSVCPSVYPYICPSVCPSMRPSLHPSTCLIVRPSIRPSACPSVRLSVCPSVRPSIRTSVRSSARLGVRLSVRPPVCPSVCLSVRPSVRQAPYLVYVEVLRCDNAHTAPVPGKILENTLRQTRSEEDLTSYLHGHTLVDPRPEPAPPPLGDFDAADCWSQEDDDIIQVPPVAPPIACRTSRFGAFSRRENRVAGLIGGRRFSIVRGRIFAEVFAAVPPCVSAVPPCVSAIPPCVSAVPPCVLQQYRLKCGPSADTLSQFSLDSCTSADSKDPVYFAAADIRSRLCDSVVAPKKQFKVSWRSLSTRDNVRRRAFAARILTVAFV